MKSIELLQEHCEFKSNYDCYVLLAVSRKKDTPEISNSQEIVFREVIKNEKDIVRKYNKIKAQLTNYRDENGKSYPFYLYVSLNARDSRKATFILMSQIQHWIQEELNGVDNSRMFKKIYGHFFSALMRKESRVKKRYFMIDFDEKESLKQFKEDFFLQTKEEILIERETKNGYHFKINAFNKMLLEPIKEDYDFEVKIDSNFFVEYIDNKEDEI